MRKTRIAKILAASTAATMLLAPATVFADDVTDPGSASSGINGDGSLEGYVNKEVFRVVLPTIQNVNFTLDPQGLLNKADKNTYATGAGAVYFENAKAGGGDPTYSNTSDEIVIYNKSSYDVEVGLSVTMDTGDVTLAAKNDLTTAKTPSLYLGLIKGTDAATAITTSSYDSAAATVTKVPEVDGTTVTKGYQIKANTSAVDGVDKSPNGFWYTYELTSDFADTDAQKISYKLEGACDSKADWSKIDTKAVTAKVAWTITKAGEPSVSGKAYNRQNTENTYTLKNFTGKTIKSLKASNEGNISAAVDVPSTAYTVDSGVTTLKIDGTKSPIGAGAVGKTRYFHVTLDDDSVVTFSVNVTDVAP